VKFSDLLLLLPYYSHVYFVDTGGHWQSLVSGRAGFQMKQTQ